ncbi:hypothetical protein JOB18_019712 [Solea senegalensis]|uniref:Uncharacterized protein n=1 Tax=Solea senegalensis TaxID=28829 RepID=A0AAV6SSK8_SOLSE|nr:hypothetical protein JOB18_019712 [Solea senegalensis]
MLPDTPASRELAAPGEKTWLPQRGLEPNQAKLCQALKLNTPPPPPPPTYRPSALFQPPPPSLLSYFFKQHPSALFFPLPLTHTLYILYHLRQRCCQASHDTLCFHKMAASIKAAACNF